MESKVLRTIAFAQNRDYITPEDISDAYILGTSYEDICEEFLGILGRFSPEYSKFGIEDKSLTAFNILNDKPK